MTVPTVGQVSPSPRTPGWVPFALLTLAVLPALFGALRIIGLAGGPQLMPASPRMSTSPIPVSLHIVAAVLFAVLGAFQFSPDLRRRHRVWHRVTGRIVVVLGLTVAASALWMTIVYPRQPGSGPLAYLFRLAFGSGLAVALTLAVHAVRYGRLTVHRRWMIRAYALALGAGTQVLTGGVGPALFGSGDLVFDLSLGAGWVINLGCAEYVIRHPLRRRRSHSRGPDEAPQLAAGSVESR